MILVFNCGSSTVKFAAFETPPSEPLLQGVAEALGSPAAKLRVQGRSGIATTPLADADHAQALNAITQALRNEFPHANIVAIGHRVVHGGEFFRQAVVINEAVEAKIEKLSTLAPLHNPAHLLGIRASARLFPGAQQVAVFDTAFHQTMPEVAFRYAIPEQFYRQHAVRRYGAHGTSHRFVAQAAAERLGRPFGELQLLTAHLGNGCSGCAIRHGFSVDTTMGLTPQEGMMMGTRSGDVDPTLHQYLATAAGLSLAATTGLLTRQSGLLGVSGSTNDCRELESRMNAGDERARLALEMFCYRAAKSLLGLTAGLARVDALIFTGGIGENSPFVRRRIVEQLPLLGIQIDNAANDQNGKATNGQIDVGSGTGCLVIPTLEELAIAREVEAITRAQV